MIKFKNFKILLLSLPILLFFKNIYSAEDIIGYSSRIKAMGDVVCGIADTVETVAFNPAGLHNIENPQISLGYQILWLLLTENENIGSGYITLSYPFKKIGSLGLTYSNFSISDLYQQHISFLTYSNKLSKSLLFGFNAKYLSFVYNINSDDMLYNPYFSTFGNQKNNFSLDVGVLYKKEKFSFGLSAINVNQPKMSLNPQEKDFLNTKINLGLGIYPIKTLIVGGELSYSSTLKAALGFEKVFPKESISIRAGGNYDLKGAAEFSIGFGYKIPVQFGGIMLNYSFSYPLAQISDTAGHHFVSFLIDFSKESRDEAIYYDKQTTTKYEDQHKLKEEIERSIKSQLIKLELSKEVLRKDDTELKFKVEITTEVVGWQLIISDSKNKVVKKFYSNLQEQEIIWDLKTEDGIYILPGKYKCFVVGINKEDKKIESQIKTFVLTEKLQRTFIQQETIICPNCGAENIKGERFCVRCREPLPR